MLFVCVISINMNRQRRKTKFKFIIAKILNANEFYDHDNGFDQEFSALPSLSKRL